jgi:hypothetical protein
MEVSIYVPRAWHRNPRLYISCSMAPVRYLMGPPAPHRARLREAPVLATLLTFTESIWSLGPGITKHHCLVGGLHSCRDADRKVHIAFHKRTRYPLGLTNDFNDRKAHQDFFPNDFELQFSEPITEAAVDSISE